MPLLSVITAAYKPNIPFVIEAWASIDSSIDLGGWDLEWLLQEDGEASGLVEHLPSDERIHYEANGSHAGAAATRNSAIARANGSWIVNLDSDDFFAPGGLAALVAAWTEYPSAIWAGGRAHDFLQETRQVVEFPNYLSDGLANIDDLLAVYDTHGVGPFHVAGGAMRTSVMRALGGYLATPVGEDSSLFMAAAAVGPGVYTSTPVFNYRRWPGQSTNKDEILQWHRKDWVRQRVAAVRECGLTLVHPTD